MKSEMKLLITVVDRFSLSLIQTLILSEEIELVRCKKLEEAFIGQEREPRNVRGRRKEQQVCILQKESGPKLYGYFSMKTLRIHSSMC